ncbi:hypothetical protein GALL_481150 [mine drainage metagenome]|uniref:Uncharacterized protein n=1 Tax=mine drainage metagenome TaxID=410659 RepID=A0A1J5PGE8_9ZZZZ
MSRVLLTLSAVIRTPCINGCPPPEPLPLLSGDPAFAPAGVAVAFAPKPVLLADPGREPKPPDDEDELEPKPPDDEDGLLLFRESRSLALADEPEPGAIWLSALSSRPPEEEPPPNISVSTRAIWRASPYFTR